MAIFLNFLLQSRLTPEDLRQKQGDTCRKIQTKHKFTALSENSSQAVKRCLTTATERGSSSWLTVVPLEDEGKPISKQEFRDALAIGVCGNIFDINHAMACKSGGFVSHRHDRIRDLLAKRLQKVCQDVSIEPHLQPLTGELFSMLPLILPTLPDSTSKHGIFGQDALKLFSISGSFTLIAKPTPTHDRTRFTLNMRPKSEENITNESYMWKDQHSLLFAKACNVSKHQSVSHNVNSETTKDVTIS